MCHHKFLSPSGQPTLKSTWALHKLLSFLLCVALSKLHKWKSKSRWNTVTESCSMLYCMLYYHIDKTWVEIGFKEKFRRSLVFQYVIISLQMNSKINCVVYVAWKHTPVATAFRRQRPELWRLYWATEKAIRSLHRAADWFCEYFHNVIVIKHSYIAT